MCVVATAAATSEGLDPRSTIDRTTNRLDQALVIRMQRSEHQTMICDS